MEYSSRCAEELGFAIEVSSHMAHPLSQPMLISPIVIDYVTSVIFATSSPWQVRFGCIKVIVSGVSILEFNPPAISPVYVVTMP
jgi:hypothetical protein